MTARPVRTCVGCRARFTTGTLVRIAMDDQGRLVVGGPSNGRGVWLCSASPACVERAIRSKALGRGLRVAISQDEERRLAERLWDAHRAGSTAGGPSTAVS